MIDKACFNGASVAVIALKQVVVKSPLQVAIGRSISVRVASAGTRAPFRKTSARENSERVTFAAAGDGWAADGGLDEVRPPRNGSERKLIVLRTIKTIKNRTTAPAA